MGFVNLDKLGNDELIIIMISIKKQYEEQYKIMEDKYNSLSKYCKERRQTTLLNSGICGCCKDIIYSVCDPEFDNECCISDNYLNCSGCNKVICYNCLNNKDFCIIECIHDPKPTKYWCKNCHAFNDKMATLK